MADVVAYPVLLDLLADAIWLARMTFINVIRAKKEVKFNILN
jgi:hypothetical protein